jgi:predicted phosphodiesterase
MKYAIISDLHANLEAVAAVLTRIDELGVGEVLCLGDFVGYHAEPNEVVDLISSRPVRAIAGNHDRTAVSDAEPGDFAPQARRAIQWTRTVLAERTKDFLTRLPTSLSIGDSILLTHGAVHPSPNADVRLNSEHAVVQSFSVLQREFPRIQICFFGHVHRPLVYELSGGTLSRLAPRPTTLRSDGVYLINPGSVGQPRDGDARSSFCVLDTDRQRLEFYRVPYDVASCHRKAKAAGLMGSAFGGERLWRLGRKWLRRLHGP